MQLSKCLAGQTPYQTLINVYDTGTLEDGTLMMFNTAGALSSGAPNDGSAAYYIKAAADTSAEATDAIGVLQASSTNAYADKMNSALNAAAYKIGSDYYADAALTAGGNYLPCIISPEVMYYAEYYQKADADSGANVISANITASTSTTVTITALQDHLDAGWLYSTNMTDSAAYEPGQLNYISSSTGAGVCILTSAMKLGTTSDLILLMPRNHTRLALTDDAVGLRSVTNKSADTAAVSSAVSLLLWENYGRWGSAPMHPLRKWVDDATTGIKRAQFFGEIILTDHLWAVKPA